MKKRIVALLISFGILLFSDLRAYAQIGVSAEAAVLMCANSGEILFSRNADKKLSMASTTKIMTSLIALESAMPDKDIIVTKEMVSVEGTSMGLMPGDSVSMEELIYGMLLQSGNDAANTVAHVIGGGQEGFAKLMNERATQIGMKNTNFVTASGLDDENHYSTAYDMALLACECIKNPEFLEICSQKKAKLTYGNPPYARTLTNHNKLLWKYSDTIGIKTGFTKKSGRCLVSAAKRNGVTLVAVTLNAPDDWNDHISMFEYGFSKCKGIFVSCNLSVASLKVAGGLKPYAPVRLAYLPEWISGKKCSCRIEIKPFEYAPVPEGTVVGTAIFFSEKGVVDEVPLLASESVYLKPAEEIVQEKKGLFSDLINNLKDFLNISVVK
ncbi:MAG: D-alanyl-D-alanine carboxypeptidase [Clostridia bacterium]|nr:D-alanyl-D-alanine carboxypeptidase [Clostridia bacterium]